MEASDTKYRNARLFFVLTFVYSWILWLPFVLAGFGIVTLPFDAETYSLIAVVVGAFAPLFAAVTLIVKQDGWGGAWRLIRRGFDFRVRPIYVLAALLVPLAITAGSHYFTIFAGIDDLPSTFLPENLPVPAVVVSIPYFLMMLLVGGGQEEFGWRGFAQDRLQRRFGIVKGSMLLGAIWGLWHLPLWYMPGDGHSTYPFVAFVIFTTSLSVQMGWLYNASGKKLLIPWLFHAMSNTVAPLFPTFQMAPGLKQPGYWVFAGLNALISLIIAVWFVRPLEVSESPPEITP
ncbi:MAG: CPBP family intramembrane metalloprotease [Anaerolineae bacterium]|nr:CPBP family intramembrane metalloprotease [Anaerolineae bacterium]